MCIFCDIIEGKIPSYKIYEDEKTYAFLDISCDYYGHTLVIPKHHCKNVLDANSDDLNAVINTIQVISKHYTKDLGFDGVNILNASGESAEQSVFHLHFHIIPRKSGDGLHTYPTRDKLDINLEDVKNRLKID